VAEVYPNNYVDGELRKRDARIAALEAALRPLAGIPIEDFGLEKKKDYPLHGWNGYTIHSGHVIDARKALGLASETFVPTGAGGNAKAFVCCEGVGKHEVGCPMETKVCAALGHQVPGTCPKCGNMLLPDGYSLS
jgi:hypothetical protein